MSTSRRVKERQARNLALARRDAARRCPICKRARPQFHFWAPYCSEDCAVIADQRAYLEANPDAVR